MRKRFPKWVEVMIIPDSGKDSPQSANVISFESRGPLPRVERLRHVDRTIYSYTRLQGSQFLHTLYSLHMNGNGIVPNAA